jgi:hypothetical protein
MSRSRRKRLKDGTCHGKQGVVQLKAEFAPICGSCVVIQGTALPKGTANDALGDATVKQFPPASPQTGDPDPSASGLAMELVFARSLYTSTPDSIY